MNGEDVLAVLDALEQAGVRVWVDGGWGVDALLGEQTREHLDLDLAIRTEDLSHYLRTLIDLGFRTSRIDGPYNFVMKDAAGRAVDVHLVDFTGVAHDEVGVPAYGGRGLAYDVGSLGGTGWINGREVRCCTAIFQMKSHTGYPLDEIDLQDVLALHNRFGLPVPAEYDTFR